MALNKKNAPMSNGENIGEAFGRGKGAEGMITMDSRAVNRVGRIVSTSNGADVPSRTRMGGKRGESNDRLTAG